VATGQKPQVSDTVWPSDGILPTYSHEGPPVESGGRNEVENRKWTTYVLLVEAKKPAQEIGPARRRTETGGRPVTVGLHLSDVLASSILVA
jgi:hypothetical protein